MAAERPAGKSCARRGHLLQTNGQTRLRSADRGFYQGIFQAQCFTARMKQKTLSNSYLIGQNRYIFPPLL